MLLAIERLLASAAREAASDLRASADLRVATASGIPDSIETSITSTGPAVECVKMSLKAVTLGRTMAKIEAHINRKSDILKSLCLFTKKSLAIIV